MHSNHHKQDHRRQILIIALISAMTFPSGLLSNQVTASSPVDREMLASFDSLQKVVANLPRTLVTVRQRGSLRDKLDRAEAVYTKGEGCSGAKLLALALNEAQSFHKSNHSAIAEDLHNRIWTLRQDILNSQPAGKTCDDNQRTNRAPKLEITESNDQHLRGRVTFGEARMSTVNVDGELYTQVDIPGFDGRIGEAGLPGVPLLHRLVAVPQGAKAVLIVKADENQTETYRLNLYPVQPEAMDRADAQRKEPSEFPFQQPAFTKDKDAYGLDEFYPARIGSMTRLGRARDLEMTQLSIAAGQYNPVSKTLTLFSSVEFHVSFIGGKGGFLNRSSISPFESLTAQYIASTINFQAIPDFLDEISQIVLQCGEEFLILTHPDFREAAEDLATWKNTKGIPTSVVNVNDGNGSGPDTRDEIDAFIEGRFNRCGLRPSYLLLLGDAEFIPTFYVSTSGSSTTGSDYHYALLSGDDADLMPDFALGRIPVDTPGQAQTVVDKIVNYESRPPSSTSFYQNVGIASQFQCCRGGSPEGRDQRSFIETSELVRNELLNNGYDVDRIYTKTGDSIPRRFYDGSLLPEELRAASGFVWDGDTDDIVNAFNAGRFLFLHRDHGSKDGWVHPSFSSQNVTEDLTNGNLLPVVFSVNCASGLFDNETANEDYGTEVDRVYFAERLLRKTDGGAVGILGDTRDSPTWANSALTRGFFDAVWPQTVSDFGGQTSLRRLGDILNHGKVYLATQVGVAGTTEAPTQGNLRSELFLWHVLGDPTLEMWTSRPRAASQKWFDVIADRQGWRVSIEWNGAILTALQHTRSGVVALGRAEVVDGKATIPFMRRPVAGVPIELSASFENAVSVRLTHLKQQ